MEASLFSVQGVLAQLFSPSRPFPAHLVGSCSELEHGLEKTDRVQCSKDMQVEPKEILGAHHVAFSMQDHHGDQVSAWLQQADQALHGCPVKKWMLTVTDSSPAFGPPKPVLHQAEACRGSQAGLPLHHPWYLDICSFAWS
ncbi:hypothetical protein MC885_016717 [Smutsia gigantea]|nr:hypothetical protein MC885_016717 [Smutsia gigantea]